MYQVGRLRYEIEPVGQAGSRPIATELYHDPGGDFSAARAFDLEALNVSPGEKVKITQLASPEFSPDRIGCLLTDASPDSYPLVYSADKEGGSATVVMPATGVVTCSFGNDLAKKSSLTYSITSTNGTAKFQVLGSVLTRVKTDGHANGRAPRYERVWRGGASVLATTQPGVKVTSKKIPFPQNAPLRLRLRESVGSGAPSKVVTLTGVKCTSERFDSESREFKNYYVTWGERRVDTRLYTGNTHCDFTVNVEPKAQPGTNVGPKVEPAPKPGPKAVV